MSQRRSRTEASRRQNTINPTDRASLPELNDNGVEGTLAQSSPNELSSDRLRQSATDVTSALQTRTASLVQSSTSPSSSSSSRNAHVRARSPALNQPQKLDDDNDCVVLENIDTVEGERAISAHKRKRSSVPTSNSVDVTPEDTGPVHIRTHAIATFFQNHHVGAVDQCADLWWSASTQSLIKTVDTTLFYPQGLPRSWLWSMLRPGPGHTTDKFTDLSHGRGICDLSDIEATSPSYKRLLSALVKYVTNEVCNAIIPNSGRDPWVTVDDAVLFVNAVRSTRTPFLVLGEPAAPDTNTFVVVVTFRAGCWVALWDEKPPEHRLDTVTCNTPILGFLRGLCFLNTPLSFVTPYPSDFNDLAVNGIVIRFRASSTPHQAAVKFPIVFDFKPEFWIVRTAHVPPLLRCTVCLGAIRDRKFEFEGSKKKFNDTIKGGGFHCRLCNAVNEQGQRSPRFLLCEFCSRFQLFSVPQQLSTSSDSGDDDSDVLIEIMKMRTVRDLFPNISMPQTSPVFRCAHRVFKVPNRVEEVVWSILHPQEFMKAAQFFLDFTISATWLKELAPPAILNAQEKTPVLVWDAFFRCYVKNSQCNRAKLALFAIHFALNLTGMFKARDRAHKREVFFESPLPLQRRGRIDCIFTDRVRMLTEMANGLVRADVLGIMARRLIKYLDGDMWGQVLYCSCTGGDTPMNVDDYHVGHRRTRCDGPLLELAHDGGIEERLSWGAFNARSVEQVRLLRVYQEVLRQVSKSTRLEFIEGVHVVLPA